MKKWHIDPIIPYRTGAARRLLMLKSGRKMTFDPLTGGIVIRQGNKVFEIRPIEEEKDIYLLFLINYIPPVCQVDCVQTDAVQQQLNSYATWKIKDGKFVPKNFDIRKYCERFSIDTSQTLTLIGNVSKSPATSTGKKTIYITKSDDFFPYGADYGTCGLRNVFDFNPNVNPNEFLLIGLRNDYEKNVFNNDQEYLNRGFSFPTFANPRQYISSSKHPSIIYEGEKITNLEFWTDSCTVETTEMQEGTGHIEYLDKGGNSVTMPSMPYSFQVHNPAAILSPTKLIGTYGDAWDWIVPMDILDPYHLYSPDPYTSLMTNDFSPFGSWEYKFGEHVIGHRTYVSNGSPITRTCFATPRSSVNSGYGYGYWPSNSWISEVTTKGSSGLLFPIEYESNNIDESFCMIVRQPDLYLYISKHDVTYHEYVNPYWTSAIVEDWSYYQEQEGENQSGFGATNFKLIYKSKNGPIVERPICAYTEGAIERRGNTPIGCTVGKGVFWDEIYTQINFNEPKFGWYAYGFANPPGGTWKNRLPNSGSVVRDVTITKDDKYFYYSYTIFEGVTASGIDDINPAHWNFVKRMMCSINMEDGTQSENEVTDEFIGSNFVHFDKTIANAIGVRKVKGV